MMNEESIQSLKIHHKRLLECMGGNEATTMHIEMFAEKGETGMSEQRASYDLSPRDQLEPSDLHKLSPCLYELGDHILEIIAEEQAMIVNRSRLDETVILQKDELYHLLVVLQELFVHDTL